MSEVKALEDMRNTVKTIAADCDEGWILECLDAIEAEIAERFMELPVDADGVPIRVGETVYDKYIRGNHEYTVSGLEFDQAHGQWNIKLGDASWASQGLLSHVKPRTVESLVSGFADEVWNAALDPAGTTYSDSGLRESEARLCAEIRELLREVGD